MFESVGATAMALMLDAGVVDPRIELQVGVGYDAVVVRHRLPPPASSEFRSFGSIMNGAIKFCALNINPELISLALPVSPPFVERKTCMF